MKHQVERRGGGAVLRGDAGLDLAQQLRTQLHVARLVHAVHVTEGERGNVAALLAHAEGFDRGDDIIQCRVEAVVDVVAHTVFFTADHADLDLEDGVDRFHAGQQRCGDPEVLFERNSRSVPHV